MRCVEASRFEKRTVPDGSPLIVNFAYPHQARVVRCLLQLPPHVEDLMQTARVAAFIRMWDDSTSAREVVRNWSGKDDIEDSQWLKLLHPFTM
jgi:hypothetical protein